MKTINSLTREGKIIVFGGLAVVLIGVGIYFYHIAGRGGNPTPITQVTQERVKLYENRKTADIPPAEFDTTLDPENKIAIIRWWDGNTQQNIELKLPYELETDFAGCSESVKQALRHLRDAQVR